MTPQIFHEIDRGHIANVRRHLSSNPNALHATTATDGQTPLHRAAALGNEDMICELLAHDAKHDVEDKHGNTPLHLACQSGSIKAVSALLGPKNSDSLRCKNRDGQTPLHVAVLVGTKETVRRLVEAGAQLDVRDKDGHVPFDLLSAEQSDLYDVLAADGSDASEGQPSPAFSPTAEKSREIDSRMSRKNRRHTRDSSEAIPMRTVPTGKGRRMKHLSSSPDRGYANLNDVTQRSLPRKQLQLHEMAIQGLQSELQDLGFRTDNIEHFLNESQENFDKLENLATCIDGQDRQLAELDQRLKFQEEHLRELRPRINCIGDESRENKQQSEALHNAVESLRETARESLGSVLARVKEWETLTLNYESQVQADAAAEPEFQNQIDDLEQKILDTHRLVQEARVAAERSTLQGLALDKSIRDVRGKMSAMEDFIKETTATTDDSTQEEEEAETKRQIHDLMENYAAMKTVVARTAAQTDRIEEMFKEQMKFEQRRRAEQDAEISTREAKILELRRIALEEENERRDFSRTQEEQRSQMRVFEEKVLLRVTEVAAQCQQETQQRTELESKIKVMEAELLNLHTRLEAKENEVKKGGCCVIN